MTGHRQSAADALRALRQNYRALEAPPFMANRIRAAIDEQARRRTRRRPMFAAIAVVICLLAVLPFMQRQEATLPQSMASLPMGLTSVRLPSLPSLAKLRSIRTPALPPRPVTPARDRAGKQTDVQTRNPKEKTHEVT